MNAEAFATRGQACAQNGAGETGPSARALEMDAELRLLFHRLNNQLGIILAHAELLEARAIDDLGRARAAQVVTSVLAAMETTLEIRRRSEPETGQIQD